MGTCCRSKSARAPGLTRIATWMFGFACGAGALLASDFAFAIKSDSPEVRGLVDAGLAVLEKPIDEQQYANAARLGGKCIVGLAFVKAGKPTHTRVDEAISAIRTAMAPDEKVDVYSNGIVIVFLCELDPKRYQREIQWYLDLLRQRQKDHGGWGYDGNSVEGFNLVTGDTSQTQYGSLGYW